MNFQKKARTILLQQIREKGGQMDYDLSDRNPQLQKILEALVEEGKLTSEQVSFGVTRYRLKTS